MRIVTTKLFNPLSGTELKAILMADFEKMLDNSGHFQPHLTYSLAKVHLDLIISSDPPLYAPLEMGMDTVLEVQDRVGLPTDKENVTLSLEKALGMVPDQDREDHNLPVKSPALSDTGHIVDKEVKRTSATVGKGTKPRGNPNNPVHTTVAPDLDDSGAPVKVNKA